MKQLLENIFENNSDTVLFAYLFGSHAEETMTPRSDIDVAVFLKDGGERLFFDKKIDLYMQLSRAMKRNDIDVVVMNTCRNILLLNNITTHGIVVYSQDETMRLDYEQRVLHSAIDFKHQRFMAMGI